MNKHSPAANDPGAATAGDEAALSDLARAMQQAERLELAGKPADAERMYRALLPTHSESAPLLHHLALLLRQRGELAEAQYLLFRAVVAEPNDASLHNSLGVVLQEVNRLGDAADCYRAALGLQPGYAEARYNLGTVLEAMNRPDEALAAYREALSLQPRYARAQTRIAAVLQQQGAMDQALDVLDQAVASNPHYFDAHYHRGTVLSSLRRHDEALHALGRAAALRPGSFEAVLATANALRDAARHDEALAAYWHAMELRPERVATHEELNRLAWAVGRRDLFLRSFGYARQMRPPDPDLLILEAGFHLRREEHARAEELMWVALRRAPQRGDVQGMLARAMAGQGRFEEAYAMFSAAIIAEPQDMLHRHQLGFSLLRDGQPAPALEVFQQALPLDPFDQLVLAGQTLAYRELGDSRHGELFDPARYIKTYDIRPPSGFAGREAFNQALAQELDALHTMVAEPIDQTLRGGTQTSGRLFSAAAPLVQELRAAIGEAVADYIGQLPQAAQHPMSRRQAAAGQDFDYIGSWSCRLGGQGFHTNHVHPMGWISSAYYVRLPREVEDDKRRRGWLKFGESNLGLGGKDQPDRYIRPEVGRLVLFPSFYWHGTVPFSVGEDRLSVAFDVVPGAAAAGPVPAPPTGAHGRG